MITIMMMETGRNVEVLLWGDGRTGATGKAPSVADGRQPYTTDDQWLCQHTCR